MRGSAVLFSGGLDSAVLLARELRATARCAAVHVRAGLAWEDAEARAIARTPGRCRPSPAACDRSITLGVDMRDVYPRSHWALTGRAPAYDTPDEDVYLEGRNIVLIAKTAVVCARAAHRPARTGPARRQSVS